MSEIHALPAPAGVGGAALESQNALIALATPTADSAEPAAPSVPTVRCLHCHGSIPAGSFVYWAEARRAVLMFAPCPTCRRGVILPELTFTAGTLDPSAVRARHPEDARPLSA